MCFTRTGVHSDLVSHLTIFDFPFCISYHMCPHCLVSMDLWKLLVECRHFAQLLLTLLFTFATFMYILAMYTPFYLHVLVVIM